MERLTYRTHPSKDVYLAYGLDAIWRKKLKKLRYDIITNAVDRLAAYEDSGLTPEQVQELAKAKADGRLVVLPCKIGDRVYSIYGYLNKSIQEDTVKHICVQDGEIRLTMDNTCTKIWERSAFATREEAEKALEMRE